MHRLFVIRTLFCLLCLALLAACSSPSSSPSSVVKAFYYDLAAGNVKAASAKMHPDFFVAYNGFKGFTAQGLLEMEASEFKKEGGLADIVVSTEDVTAARHVVHVTLKFKNGTSRNESPSVVEKGGKWLLEGK